jgi:hypothetical protein
VSLKAATGVFVGEKIDQHCLLTVEATGDVRIGQKIDGNSAARITTSNGSIFIGQKIDGNSTAQLNAPNGNITIGEKIDGDAVVTGTCKNFSCPNTSGGQVSITTTG